MSVRRLEFAAEAEADIEIAPAALHDLNEILDNTEERWGLEQALAYSDILFAAFDRLRAFPESGRKRSDVDEGLRSVVAGEHVVFFECCRT